MALADSTAAPVAELIGVSKIYGKESSASEHSTNSISPSVKAIIWP